MRINNFQLHTDDEVIKKIVGEVLRAFHFEFAHGEAADFDEFDITNKIDGDKVKTYLTASCGGSEKIFTEVDKIRSEEKRSAEIHRLIKKNLYKIITDNLKLPPVPYGIMHGVRPTKIIHRWMRSGYGVTSHGIIDRDKISRRLRKDYLTSYEKAQLLTEVAIRQIPLLKNEDDKTISIYVGIPFCVTRCLYCSFPSNVLPSDEKVAEFMAVLSKDIDAAAEEIKRYNFKVQTIYVGGGTPTALPEKFFVEMLEKVFANFYSDTVEEFTVECGRPDTITAEKIDAMKKFKVTRVSVNPQTMQQKTLDRIGRQHTVEQVVTAFNEIRNSTDFKINMDLILGLPGENVSDVQDSLEKVLNLNPDDITLHALALKRGSQLQTRLADEVQSLEDFDLPSDEEVQKMSCVAEKILREKNYLPYYLYRQGYISGQIENIGWCKKGSEGIYNVQIMEERQTILGVGAAASTKVPDNEEMRMLSTFNAKDLTTYLQGVDKYIDNRRKSLADIYKVELESSQAEKMESEIEKPAEVEDLPTVSKIVSEVEEEKNIPEPENKPAEKVAEVVENEITLEKTTDAEKIAELEEKISAPVEIELEEKVIDENLTVTEVVKKKSKKRKKKNKTSSETT